MNAKSSINNLLLFAGDFPHQDDLKYCLTKRIRALS